MTSSRNPDLPTRKGRPRFSIRGGDDGTWELAEDADLHWLRGADWYMVVGMSAKNDRKNLSVEGATVFHPGFMHALSGIIRGYPEIEGYLISFDGPMVRVADLNWSAPSMRWEDITFYHGTSLAAWPGIEARGLGPRSATGSRPMYGSSVGAREGRVDAVYLAVESNMCRFAARDAARRTGSEPVVLRVFGLSGAKMRPDEDSGEAGARMSLARMGSVAYVGTIPVSKISFLNPGTSRNPSSSAPRVSPKVKSHYEVFHGVEPEECIEMSRTWVPGSLVCLGRCVDVGYGIKEANSTKEGRYVHPEDEISDGVKVYRRARSGERPDKTWTTFPKDLMVMGWFLGLTVEGDDGKKEIKGSQRKWACATPDKKKFIVVGRDGVEYVVMGGRFRITDWIRD
jgi:hypothetical protein